MLRNYIAVALRNIRREKAYAFINIAGLAIGLTICLLVLAYVADEWSYDSFHADKDRLYRVLDVDNSSGETRYSAGTTFPMAELIQDNIPEVTDVVQFIPDNEAIFSVNGQEFRQNFAYADPNFFEMFSFDLASGDPHTVLTEPSSIVLTTATAVQMFGQSDPLGKQLSVTVSGRTREYTVTGVAEEVPSNSSLQFSILVPKAEAKHFSGFELGWNLTWAETYIRIRPDVVIATVNEKLNVAAQSIPQIGDAPRTWQFTTQAITDLHLSPEVGGSEGVSSPTYSYLLGGIGLIVLSLACINFTTLAIGRSQRRVREIGVRKVMGASQNQLYGQLLGEAVIMSGLALIAACALAELFLPTFNGLAGKELSSILYTTGWWLVGIIVLVVLTALFAGAYPAMILTRTKTVDAVRGKASMLSGGMLTRILIAIQFTLSGALIVITLTMSRQLNYMQDMPLGFNEEQLVLVSLRGAGPDERMNIIDRLRNSLHERDGVVSIAASSTGFDGRGWRNGTQAGPDSVMFSVFLNAVDHEYVSTMGLQLVAGETFRQNAPREPTLVLVNETFVKQYTWEDPMGKEIPGIGGSQIIGIVKDYFTQSLAVPMEPMALLYAGNGSSWAEAVRYAFIRINPNNIPATMQRLREVWDEAAPNLPYTYEFMDEHIEAQYRSYERWANIVGNAASLAVIVACFGVFGLTALAIARRRKEIGIRKVLGARSGQLVALLNREFVVLALIGTLIGWPFAYYAANEWLAGFAYRAPISAWPFVAGVVMLVGIVIATVSVQAVRAAQTNPTDAIRYE